MLGVLPEEKENKTAIFATSGSKKIGTSPGLREKCTTNGNKKTRASPGLQEKKCTANRGKKIGTSPRLLGKKACVKKSIVVSNVNGRKWRTETSRMNVKGRVIQNKRVTFGTLPSRSVLQPPIINKTITCKVDKLHRQAAPSSAVFKTATAKKMSHSDTLSLFKEKLSNLTEKELKLDNLVKEKRVDILRLECEITDLSSHLGLNISADVTDGLNLLQEKLSCMKDDVVVIANEMKEIHQQMKMQRSQVESVLAKWQRLTGKSCPILSESTSSTSSSLKVITTSAVSSSTASQPRSIITNAIPSITLAAASTATTATLPSRPRTTASSSAISTVTPVQATKNAVTFSCAQAVISAPSASSSTGLPVTTYAIPSAISKTSAPLLATTAFMHAGIQTINNVVTSSSTQVAFSASSLTSAPVAPDITNLAPPTANRPAPAPAAVAPSIRSSSFSALNPAVIQAINNAVVSNSGQVVGASSASLPGTVLPVIILAVPTQATNSVGVTTEPTSTSTNALPLGPPITTPVTQSVISAVNPTGIQANNNIAVFTLPPSGAPVEPSGHSATATAPVSLSRAISADNLTSVQATNNVVVSSLPSGASSTTLPSGPPAAAFNPLGIQTTNKTKKRGWDNKVPSLQYYQDLNNGWVVIGQKVDTTDMTHTMLKKDLESCFYSTSTSQRMLLMLMDKVFKREELVGKRFYKFDSPLCWHDGPSILSLTDKRFSALLCQVDKCYPGFIDFCQAYRSVRDAVSGKCRRIEGILKQEALAKLNTKQ